MGLLNEVGIVVGKNNKAAAIFEALLPSFYEVQARSPSEYVKKYWSAYETYVNNLSVKQDGEKKKNLNNLNGKILEYIVATCMLREGIKPFYIGANVAFVPDVNFDFIFYTKEIGIVCISCKTSLRERYKQAELEGRVLKMIHRKAPCYLITLADEEAKRLQLKVERGDVAGLDAIILANDVTFDNLVSELKKLTYVDSPQINVVSSGTTVRD